MDAQAASAGPFPVPGLTPPTKRTGVKRRIGDVIVQLGFAERELVESVVEDGRRNGLPLGQALIEAGIVNSGQLAQALAERNGLDYVDLNVFDVDKGAASMIDGGKARRYRTIPIAFLAERELLVATADPANLLALDDITMATGFEVRRAVASPEDIDALIEKLGTLESSVHEIEDEEVEAQVIELRESADDAPVVKLVHAVIADAVRRGASDIHFEPYPNEMRVRCRVDGVVFDSTTVPRHLDLRPRVPDQDHGRARHRREAHAAGRPHRPVGGRQLRGPARGDASGRARRVGRDAHPRLAPDRHGPRRARHGRRATAPASRPPSGRRTARSS